MKFLSKIGALLSLVALPLLAGPMPFTQNQFPVFYLTSGPVTTTSSTETNLYQTSIPNNLLLNNGVLRITVATQKGTLTNTATLKIYLGGSGNPPTGGTCIQTNSLVASAHSLMQSYLVVTNLSLGSPALTNTYVGQTTTNTFNASTFVFNPVFSTATNPFTFTITGQSDSTNTFGLDFALAEFIALP